MRQENPLVPSSSLQGALGIISFVLFYPPPPLPTPHLKRRRRKKKKCCGHIDSSSSLFYSVSSLLLIISRADVELGGPSRRRLFKLVGCSLTLVACVDDTTTIYFCEIVCFCVDVVGFLFWFHCCHQNCKCAPVFRHRQNSLCITV